MVTILLPTMAANKNDIEIMLGLLERTVEGNHEIGLEIIGKPEHFQKNEYLIQIEDNIKSVADNMVHRVVHGFSGPQVYESGISDMRTIAGRNLLETYIKLGKNVNAGYVHVHGGAGYKGRLSPEEKTRELDNVRKNMLYYAKRTGMIEIGIENLPSPSLGDIETDPTKVWHDCVETPDDCLAVVKDTNLKVTLDTCHYATRKNELYTDLIKPVTRLGEHLGYIHLSDVAGFWVPYKSTWKEGVVPGDGRIGEESFKALLRDIGKNHPDLGICVEVYNTDFANPKESEESIKRVLKWLR